MLSFSLPGFRLHLETLTRPSTEVCIETVSWGTHDSPRRGLQRAFVTDATCHIVIVSRPMSPRHRCPEQSSSCRRSRNGYHPQASRYPALIIQLVTQQRQRRRRRPEEMISFRHLGGRDASTCELRGLARPALPPLHHSGLAVNKVRIRASWRGAQS